MLIFHVLSSLLDCFSELDPPDPIPNSEVKRFNADDSVGYPCESRSQSSILFLKKVDLIGLFFCLEIPFLFPEIVFITVFITVFISA